MIKDIRYVQRIDLITRAPFKVLQKLVIEDRRVSTMVFEKRNQSDDPNVIGRMVPSDDGKWVDVQIEKE